MAANADCKESASALAIATADSRDCAFCSGQGMATVYAPGYTGSAIAQLPDGRRYVARTTAHCMCPLGRFVRAAAKEDVRRRTPEVGDIAQGRSHWSLDDPTEEPVDNPTAPVDAAAFRRLWRQIHVSRIAKPVPCP